MDGHSMVEIPMDYLHHHSLESICYRYGHPTIIFVGFLVMGYLYNDYSTLLLKLLGTIPPAHGNVLTVVHVSSFKVGIGGSPIHWAESVGAV